MQDIMALIQMIFDTIKKYLFLLLGRADELEDETTAPAEEA